MNMPKILLKAKRIIDEGNHEEGLVLIKDFEENGDNAPFDIISCHLLQCEILRQQGLYEDLLKQAEDVFDESAKEKETLQSIDAIFYMSEALLRLFRFKEAYEKIKLAEDLLSSINQDSMEIERREAYLDFLKGWYYYPNEEADLALQHLNRSILIQKKLDLKEDLSITSALISWIYALYNEQMDLALEHGNNALKLAEEINKVYLVAIVKNVVAQFYNLRGELEKSIELQEHSLKLFRRLNNKAHTATLLNNLGEIYRMSGDLDKALKSLERSLDICFEMGLLNQAASYHDFLIRILLEMDNIERAKDYLKDMERLNNQLDDKEIDDLYLSNKASILNTSSSESDRTEARQILEYLVKKSKSIPLDVSVRNLLNLIENYLFELQNTSNLELLDKIQQYINQIIEKAKNQSLPFLLVESYLLEIEFDLIKLDFNLVQQTLTKAKKVAEKYGMIQLTNRISAIEEEYNNKKKDVLKLEQSYKIDINLMELTPLRKQINYMLHKRELFNSIKI